MKNRIASSLVKGRYKKGKKIIDLGCGSCDWNADNLNVFGIDFNRDLLKLGKQNNRLYDYKVADAASTGLPDESFDIVTSFEFLERIRDYEKVIKESRRLLKEGGHCIISVPFEGRFSLWRPLFSMQVLFQGYILGNSYYKNRCGHINHFSVEKIKKDFLKQGYSVDLVFNMRRLTIFLCARKKAISITPGGLYNDITVILPTLNEGGNISNILPYLISHYKGCNIIVADDGSQDGTKEKALSLKYKNLIFLDRTSRQIHGLTVSVLDAIELVKTEYFIAIDADGQHPPEKIEEIVNILRLGSKLVIASRVEVEKRWPLCRKTISYAGALLGKISLLLRAKYYLGYDILGGFFGCDCRLWDKCLSDRFKRKHFSLKGYKVLFDFLK
ncbi:MAG: glycosyltransferase, partial [Candidatus Omnitrophota bacterium]